MAIVTGDRYLDNLVKFVEKEACPLLEGGLILKLNPVGPHYVQSQLEQLQELEGLLAGAPVDYLRAYVLDLGDHRMLEQLRRILQLLTSLEVVSIFSQMDEYLQILPAVEIMDLSQNRFAKVDNLRKCTKLKHLDLGFNHLRTIASLSEVLCPIVKLVLRNNALTTLRGIENLKSVEGLDLSYTVTPCRPFFS